MFPSSQQTNGAGFFPDPLPSVPSVPSVNFSNFEQLNTLSPENVEDLSDSSNFSAASPQYDLPDDFSDNRFLHHNVENGTGKRRKGSFDNVLVNSDDLPLNLLNPSSVGAFALGLSSKSSSSGSTPLIIGDDRENSRHSRSSSNGDFFSFQSTPAGYMSPKLDDFMLENLSSSNEVNAWWRLARSRFVT